MSFTAFIFDMDGTLLDNMPAHTQIWMAFLDGLGFPMDPEQFNRFSPGRTNAEILREMIGPHLTDEEVLRLSDRKEVLYRQHFGPLMKPTEGLVVFLESARAAGVPMAVASSAGCENIRFHLEGLGLGAYFSILVGSEDIQNGKPDPEIFLKAAERLGVDPRSSLVFEDTPAGLEAARRAGMRAVALTSTYPAEQLEMNPAVLWVEADFSNLDVRELLESAG